MAKELPYFKFEPSEWLEGEIQVCSDESIVCFINLCSGYWLKLGNINYAFALHKYFKKDASVLQELIDNEIIIKKDDEIYISFLDKQLNEFKELSEKRSLAANKRWENKEENASVMQLHSTSNAIREDKIRIDNKKEYNNIDARKLKFAQSLKPFVDVYSKELIREFYDYWVEPNKSNSKFRQELQKTWDTERRLKTWNKNNFNNKPKQNEELNQLTTEIRNSNPRI